MSSSKELLQLQKGRSFSWIVTGRLAGMAYPTAKVHFDRLKACGVTVLISCWDQDLKGMLAAAKGPTADFLAAVESGEDPFQLIHVQFPQRGAPASPADLMPAFTAMREAWARGEGVAVHCGGGASRTGTMLSCALVYLCGWEPMQAVAHVQALRFHFSCHADQLELIRALHQTDGRETTRDVINSACWVKCNRESSSFVQGEDLGACPCVTFACPKAGGSVCKCEADCSDCNGACKDSCACCNGGDTAPSCACDTLGSGVSGYKLAIHKDYYAV